MLPTHRRIMEDPVITGLRRRPIMVRRVTTTDRESILDPPATDVITTTDIGSIGTAPGRLPALLCALLRRDRLETSTLVRPKEESLNRVVVLKNHGLDRSCQPRLWMNERAVDQSTGAEQRQFYSVGSG